MINNKKVIYFSLFIVIIVCSVFTINYFKNIEIEEFKQKSFTSIVAQSQVYLQALIKEKQNSTAIIGLGLSKNGSIIEALKKNNAKNINLQNYSSELRENSDFKNVWFQLVTKDGISIQRSWTSKYGDDITKFRIDIKDVLKKPQVLNSISVGKFDMSFKSIVPVYDEKNQFLGIIEVITHFNSISKKLKQKDIDTIILVDKRYKKQITKPFTKTFVGDYYIANLDANEKVLNYFKTIDIQEYIKNASLKKYYVDNHLNKIVTYFHLYDIKDQKMAHFLLYIDKNNISLEDIEDIKYIYNLYIFIFILLFGFLMVYIYIESLNKSKLKVEFKKNQKILDSQRSFILITNGKTLKASNSSMYQFFGFDSFEEFKKEHNNICDFFEDEEGKNYIQKEMNGKNWFEYLVSYSGHDKIVKMSDKKGKEHFFYIEFEKNNILEEDNYIITFIDITKLKNIESQLIQSEKMVSLGKMIGNIAHQWRQPLSVISIAASGLKLKDEFGKMDSESLHKNLDMIILKSKYLSETIDTFRDLVKDKKILKELVVQDVFDRVLDILEVSLNNKNIQLEKNIDYEHPIYKEMIVGELSQVLTNILNNAADVLVDRGIKEPKIIVNCIVKGKSFIISIEDNGGGISEDIINSIFEPYFTTKHESQGTGLGLYMSHKIVQESMHGKLYVRNTNIGAKFFIEIPLKK